MEGAASGPWYFKQNEDGVFVKLNEERVKNNKKHLMEQVLEVKGCSNRGQDNHVMVGFCCLIKYYF